MRPRWAQPESRTQSLRSAGFTLVELLVALLIAALLVTVATLSVGRDRAAALEREAERIAQLTGVVRQQVVLGGESVALAFARHGYQFQSEQAVEPDARQWLPVTHDRMLRRRDLAAQDIEFRLEVEGTPVALDQRPEDTSPHVHFSRTGLVTPFTLHVRDAREPERAIVLTVGPGGRAEIGHHDRH